MISLESSIWEKRFDPLPSWSPPTLPHALQQHEHALEQPFIIMIIVTAVSEPSDAFNCSYATAWRQRLLIPHTLPPNSMPTFQEDPFKMPPASSVDLLIRRSSARKNLLQIAQDIRHEPQRRMCRHIPKNPLKRLTFKQQQQKPLQKSHSLKWCTQLSGNCPLTAPLNILMRMWNPSSRLRCTTPDINIYAFHHFVGRFASWKKNVCFTTYDQPPTQIPTRPPFQPRIWKRFSTMAQPFSTRQKASAAVAAVYKIRSETLASALSPYPSSKTPTPYIAQLNAMTLSWR